MRRILQVFVLLSVVGLLCVCRGACNPKTSVCLSSLKDLLKYQTAHNSHVVLEAGTYKIDSSLYDGNYPKEWPGVFGFTGENNFYDFTGVTFEFDTALHEHFPGSVHGIINLLGGKNNTLSGFTWIDMPISTGAYGVFNDGGMVWKMTGTDNTIQNAKFHTRGSLPYGFGAIYGKTGSSTTVIPCVKLSKKSTIIFINCTRCTLSNAFIDQSSLGHNVAFQGNTDDLLIKDTVIAAESRSTQDLLKNGISGKDRNGVEWVVEYNHQIYRGSADGSVFEEMFTSDAPKLRCSSYRNNEAHCKTPTLLNRCQDMGSNTSFCPIRQGFQFTLTENGLRGYGSYSTPNEKIGKVTVLNSNVTASRGGIVNDQATGPTIASNVHVRGVAGHGQEACAGSWGSSTNGDDDATSFTLSSGSRITASSGDPAYITVLHIGRTCQSGAQMSDVLADIEVIEPEEYNRQGDALAIIEGNDHRIRLWSKELHPKKTLYVKTGDSCTTNNLLLCNLTPQPVKIGSHTTGATIYSVGAVTSGGKDNTIHKLASASDEPEVCKQISKG